MKHKELYREKHIRDDGWLSELVSRTRAKHYHKEKEEWIAIVSGRVALLLKDVYSGEQDKVIIDTTTEEYKLIYLPPYTAHAIKNIGDGEASVVVFSTTPEDQNDTIPYEIEDSK